MTCRAPRAGICGAGSTLSEYEVYFNYARTKYPETVQLRPLMWANGPAPGMQFWPPVDQPEIQSDGPKSHWVGHRQNESKEYISYLLNLLYIYFQDFLFFSLCVHLLTLFSYLCYPPPILSLLPLLSPHSSPSDRAADRGRSSAGLRLRGLPRIRQAPVLRARGA